jgi:hypothetical protein
MILYQNLDNRVKMNWRKIQRASAMVRREVSADKSIWAWSPHHTWVLRIMNYDDHDAIKR